jgi:hypothetical protein
MNPTQLAHVEALLGVKLPDPYRRLMESLPADGEILVWKQPIYLELINDADRLAVVNKELRAAGATFANDQWPGDMLAIGDDGCGNVYCVKIGEHDTALALLMYEHDPANDFVMVDPSFATLASQLKGESWSTASANTESPDFGLNVSRTVEVWKSILTPIGLDEWLSYAASDPEIDLRNYREMTNPFSQQVFRLESPGFAVWRKSSGQEIPIEYRHGRLVMEGIDKAHVSKMKRVAAALRAQVIDHLGRVR